MDSTREAGESGGVKQADGPLLKDLVQARNALNEAVEALDAGLWHKAHTMAAVAKALLRYAAEAENPDEH